jgi:hypothetical protein
MIFVMSVTQIKSSSPLFMVRMRENNPVLAISSQFLTLFLDSIEQGFFGGVQWGIAACFYQLFYELMHYCIDFIPVCVRMGSCFCGKVYNKFWGKAPPIESHELEMWITITAYTLKEFEQDNLVKDMEENSILFNNTLIVLMQHIIDYLKIRLPHYMSPLSQIEPMFEECSCSYSEITFLIQLITKTLQSIINDIQTRMNYETITTRTKTAIMMIKSLITLLKGVHYEDTVHDPHFAWFSGKCVK